MKRLLLVLCACSAPGVQDAGAVDSGVDGGTDAGVDAGSGGRYWDGGACAVKTECPCFSNDDCGPGFRCVSEDMTGTQVWCVPGARGTGAPGDVCTVEGDCSSALCVEPSSGPSRCSKLCELPAECPATLPRCIYIGFGVDRSVCSPPP